MAARRQANLTKPIKDMYFPSTYASLALHNLPCVGVGDRPVLPPKPLPANPRFVLLVDSWGQSGPPRRGGPAKIFG